jgi:hypothetical protein
MRKNAHGGREPGDDATSELTILPIEMLTASAGAGSSETKDLGGRHRPRESEQLVSDRFHLVQKGQ